MSEIKSMALDRLLMSSEDQLEDWFAHGAIAVGNKWRPAKEGEKPDKPLGQLVQERYERRERLRLMPKDSTKPPITSLGGPMLGAMTADVETTLGEPQEPEPEMVDEETQKRLTEEATLRFSTAHVTESLANLLGERDALRSRLTAYNNLAREKGVDIRSDIKVIERRIEALDRKLGLEKAA